MQYDKNYFQHTQYITIVKYMPFFEKNTLRKFESSKSRMKSIIYEIVPLSKKWFFFRKIKQSKYLITLSNITICTNSAISAVTRTNFWTSAIERSVSIIESQQQIPHVSQLVMECRYPKLEPEKWVEHKLNKGFLHFFSIHSGPENLK